MGMIGNQLAAGQALTVANDSFNGDGSTTSFTLSQTVGSVHDIEVLVDNVQQSPYDGSYSVSGTTLTFSGTPSTGTNNIYVIYNASKHITTQQVIPDDGSVHSSKIASNAVTQDKLHTNAILPITRDMTNNRVGINEINPAVTLEIGATQQREEIRLTSTGGGAQAVLGTYAGTESYVGSTNNVPLHFRTNGTNKAQIDTSGRFINPNQPAFGVRHSGVSGVDCSSSPYRLFNNQVHTTQVNRGNCFNTSNGRFTAPVSGVYHFGITIRFDGFAGSYAYVTILPSTGVYTARELSIHTGSYITHTVVGICQLSTNDTVEFQIRNSGDSSINIDADTNAYGFLIG